MPCPLYLNRRRELAFVHAPESGRFICVTLGMPPQMPDYFECNSVEERPSPQANREQSPKQNHGVDALAALAHADEPATPVPNCISQR